MRKYRNQEFLKINADDFINFKTPFHVYLLGFIWADGYILSQYKRKEIRVEITSDDMANLKRCFDKTGKWYYTSRKRENRKLQTTASCNNAKLIDFLIQYSYDKKSQVTPSIFLIIPENLKKYFLRGWIDGDGCFYSNGRTNHFSLSGTYNQDWAIVEKILKDNNIHFKVSRRVVENGNKHSCIRIWRKEDIKKIYSLIYDKRYDNIGLKRKYLKCLDITKHQ